MSLYRNINRNVFGIFFGFFCILQSAYADLPEQVKKLEKQWDHIKYEVEKKDKKEAFKLLMVSAETVVVKLPDSAAAHTWYAIVLSTYAGEKGGLGALKYVKKAKLQLEEAIELDNQIMEGSAYASLGSLYYQVPSWPIGFGDDEKAEEMLVKALDIAPSNIDNNYFYADFLVSNKRYQEAEDYLLRAQRSTPREDRPIADKGRRKEIADLLFVVTNKKSKE